MNKFVFAFGIALAAAVLPAPSFAAGPQALFQEHCASCHAPDRLGLTGPALLPESLARLRKADAVKTITQGRAATQMQGFADKLTQDEIAALVDWIYTPVEPAPSWSEAQIRASRIVHRTGLPDHPAAVFQGVDMMNLFIVVETGDHHVTVLDGDRLEPIARVPTRYALHGGPKFTPDGRYVFFASRDGWISKFDLWNLETVTEIRAGLNTRNVAVSGDGKYVAVANYLPHTLVLLDADLNLIKVLPAVTLDGKAESRVSAVYDAAPRKSFVAALKDIPELWEISYDPQAPLIFDGYVHDYKMAEGLAKPGFLNVRRTLLGTPLDDFFFDASYANVMGASRSGKSQVVNLDIHSKIADLDLPGMPHLGSGIAWQWQGRSVMATPDLKENLVSVIDMQTWKLVKRIPTPGPGFFLRSHENTPYAWADAMMDKKNKDTLTVIDKGSLEVVAQVNTDPGRTLAHIEFDRYGRYALASLMERKADGGAIIVFDAQTFKEIKRIPMDKPVGKYNLFNKISRSEGTSH
ncbi:nitrite reductase [Sulfuricystis multivorans]|uniref:nitrite reductase n=1 Tax=Sulfuricystis multivorans TaxID=2211108 RepID=UPI000F84D8A7|nr:nitrite reductase [Sulfuricystis multivorans]